MQMRVRSAAGVLGPVATLSNPAGSTIWEIGVNVDGQGDAIFYWVIQVAAGDIRVQIRAMAANGALGPIEAVSSAGQQASNAAVDQDADGDALITWYETRGTRLLGRTRARNGGLGPIQILATRVYDFYPHAVGLSSTGAAVIAWSAQDTGGNVSLKARVRSAAGVLGPVSNISPLNLHSSWPRLGVDAAGNALFAWTATFADNTKRIQTRSRRANGALSPVVSLSRPYKQFEVALPELAVNDAGAGVVMWGRCILDDDFDGVDEIIIRRSSAATTGGTFSTARQLAAGECKANRGSSDRGGSEVALDGDGDAVAVWRPLGQSVGFTYEISVKPLSAANVLGTRQTFQFQNSAQPSVATSPAGKAALIFGQGVPNRYWASFGP